jgi:O-antigen/teichoic acid export membrane protein
MAGFVRLAAILSLSRIASYGLTIISPIILVHFLTVGDFGRYREFLLYASLLQTVAAFGIRDGLLYFIPLHPQSTWRVVRETNWLTAMASVLVVAGFLALDFLSNRRVVGPYAVPVALYVLLFVNVDFWEWFWLAKHRPVPVFAYTAGRLVARMLVVVCVAVVTTDVTKIIWSLIALESLRLIVSLAAWGVLDRSRDEPRLANIRRDQLKFCIPVGFATVLSMISRNLGSVVVAKSLGAVALAQLTIGTYGEPIVLALRDSISAVVLPELVRRGAQSQDELLRLWYRSTVVNCLLLFPTAALVAWYAQPLIISVFGESYRPAIPVLQIYALVVVRCCFDFSPPLRAINKTRPLVSSNLAAALANGLSLVFLLPVAGVVGAAAALAISNWVEAAYLAWSVKRLYGVGLRDVLPWRAVAQVAGCAVAAAAVVFGTTWKLEVGLPMLTLLSALYLALFAGLLMLVRVQEAVALMRRLKISVFFARG